MAPKPLRFAQILGAGHLIDRVAKMGWFAHGFNGPTPFPWPDIKAFSDLVAHFNEWEAETVYLMSVAYCNGLARGAKPLAPFPGDDPDK